MPTTQLAMTPLNANDARCEALFASRLQPSDTPTAEMVTAAINSTVQQFGISDCIGRMAQEFGDHPDAAAQRMRWVRQLVAQAAARPQASPAPSRRGGPRNAAPHLSAAVTARQQPPGPAHGPMAITQTKRREAGDERDV